MSGEDKKLTDAEMEHAFQLDYFTKLKENNEKVIASLKRSMNDPKKQSQTPKLNELLHCAKEHQTYLGDLVYKLNQLDNFGNKKNHLTDKELTEAKEKINAYFDLTDALVKSTGIQLTDFQVEKQNENVNAAQDINSMFNISSHQQQEANLLEIRGKIVDDYINRDTHPLRTVALKSLHDAILGANGEHKKSDLMRSIVASSYANNGKTASSIKITLKSHFATSRHHPELRVLKLLSEFKEGENNPKIAKHNSEILRKIDAICKSAPTDKKSKSTSAANAFLNNIGIYTAAVLDNKDNKTNAFQVGIALGNTKAEIEKSFMKAIEIHGEKKPTTPRPGK